MKRWLSSLSVLLLAGCSAEPASLLVSGSDVALTVERVRPNFWTDGWDLSIVARNNPECQRRHHLKSTSITNVKVQVYSPEPRVFILRQGKRWYVTELNKCGFDTYPEPPPEPGELLGVFREQGGTFRFVPSAPDEKAETDAEGG